MSNGRTTETLDATAYPVIAPMEGIAPHVAFPVATAGENVRHKTKTELTERQRLNLDLYKKMYLVRKSELTIIEHYATDQMKTPMHMSMGGEAISAGLCHALHQDDQVLGSYRSHALYLAKTMETDSFFAEMYGKVTGCARGKAGSMHLASPKHGMMGSSAIVGGHVPLAIGLAFANKYKKNGRVAAAVFGDGAVEEGVFWESLNAACVYQLPVLFVCEDNGFAVHTDAKTRHGYDSISSIVERFHCNVFEEKTTDPEKLYQTTCEAIRGAKEDNRPAFLRFHYYRYLEHVGINYDFQDNYRPEQEFVEWKKQDPIDAQRTKLLESLDVNESVVATLENDVDEAVKESVRHAEQSAYAGLDETYEGVFKCQQ